MLVHDSVRIVKELYSPFTDSLESVAAEFEFHNKKMCVVEFYRPPNGVDSDFMVPFQDMLQSVKKYEFCIVCTDQNYDLLKLSQHKPTSDFFWEMDRF